jgi:WD40 repeat protein
MSEGLDSPYVGLDPFDDSHAKYFFGRRLDADVIVDNILTQHVTVLYGPSGVGKSSILIVGVPEALQRRNVRVSLGFRREWHSQSDIETWLASITKPLDPPQLKVVILDQFEDHFIYSKQPEELIKKLAELVETEDQHIHILIAVREDALYWLDTLRVYLPGLFDTTLELKHLDDDAVREAIEGPIRVWNESRTSGKEVCLDKNFAETLIRQLKETGESVGGATKGCVELAYLQLALQCIWDAEGGRDAKALRTSTLEVKLKGVREIAHRHVDAVLDQLPEEQKAICEKVLDRLVTSSGGKIAYATADLAPIAAETTTQIQAVLEPLTRGRNRILRAVRSVGTSGAGFEVLHAILAKPIYDWTQRRIRLREATEIADELVKDRELEATKTHAAELKQVSDRLKWALSGLAILAVLLAVAVLQAAQNYRLALARQLTLRSTSELYSGNADRALLVSLEARQVSNIAETRGGVLRALQRMNGIRAFLPVGEEGVVKVAFHADGKVFATAGSKGRVQIWDTTTLKSVRTETFQLGTDTFTPSSLTFSKDGTRLVASDVSARTKSIALSGATPEKTPAGNVPEQVSVSADSLSFAFWIPDGSSLSVKTRTEDEGKLTTGELLGSDVPNAHIESVALSADGKIVAVAIGLDDRSASNATLSTRLVLWDIRQRTSKTLDLPIRIGSLMFAGPANGLVFVGTDTTIGVWNPSTGKLWYLDNQYRVTTLSITADGRFMALGSAGGIVIWDLAAKAKKWSPVQRDSAAPIDLALSPDGSLLVAATSDHRAVVWDAAGSDLLHRMLVKEAGGISSLAFRADGKAVGVGNQGGGITFFRLDEPAKRQELSKDSGIGAVLAVSRDGRYVAYGGSNREIVIASKQAPPLRVVAPGAISSVAFNPKSDVLAWASWDGTLSLTDPANRSTTALSKQPSSIAWGLAFNNAGTVLAAAGSDGTVRLWNLVTKKANLLPLGSRVVTSSVAFSPDDTILGIGGWKPDGVTLWNLIDGHVIGGDLMDHTESVTSVAFNPIGTMVAAGSFDRDLVLWDSVERVRLGDPLIGHDDKVGSIAFSPDGKLLASGGADGAVMIWNVDPDDWARVACDIANRNLTKQEWKNYVEETDSALETRFSAFVTRMLSGIIGPPQYTRVCAQNP